MRKEVRDILQAGGLSTWKSKNNITTRWKRKGITKSKQTKKINSEQLSHEQRIQKILERWEKRQRYSIERSAYWNARDRCNNPKNDAYDRYGGRGIKFLYVSFEQFIEDIGEKPNPFLSLDRINNDGNYEPGNCRWTDRFTQLTNKSYGSWKPLTISYERIKNMVESIERRKQKVKDKCFALHIIVYFAMQSVYACVRVCVGALQG